jgi:predicted nicotinamide N-methyase
MSPIPRLHATPPEAIAEYVRETAYVGDYRFLLERPAGVDELWEHPAVRAAYAADEYIPYWSELWPAARMLAKAIAKEDWTALETTFGKPLKALELGCGLGLSGITALARGLHVTFSDIDETAAMLAGRNAQLNGFDSFRTMAIDIRSVPPGMAYPVILVADVLYEPRLIEPMVRFIKAVLKPEGLCLVADADRISARPFRWTAEQAGLIVDVQPVRAGEPGGERTKGKIYRIRVRP